MSSQRKIQLNILRNGGFSLLELILAIAIFSLSSYGIATMLIDANITTRTSTERIAALFYAKEGIEAVRSIRDNDLSTWSALPDGDYELVYSDDIWNLSTTSDQMIDDKYTRIINFENQTSSSVKLVNSTVSWDLTPSRNISITLTSLFSNWISVLDDVVEEEFISQIPTDGLVSYWSFDGDATDNWGSNDGTLYGDTVLTTGVKGVADTAYAFDGNGDYISVLDSSDAWHVGFHQGTQTNITITTWIKLSNYTTNILQPILSSSDGFSPNKGISFEYEGRTGTSRYGLVWKISRGVSGSFRQIVSSAPSGLTITDNNWHFVAASVSSAGVTFQIDDNSIYVAGSASQTNTGNTTYTLKVAGSGQSSFQLNGSVDNVRIYNRALTAEEISAIYNEEKP